MNDHFDLAVIGGGPAGCSAAISAAQQGHCVLLLERGDFPRQKVCGEFVSSESLALLKDLLRHSETWNAGPLEITRARIFVDGKVRETSIFPAANSIPRFLLDTALWQEAWRSSVKTLANHPVNEITGSGPFLVITGDGTFTARAVINASGRWSGLNVTKGPVRNAAIGLKRHYYETTPSPSVDLYFFPGGYCGVQPIGTGEINVSAMVSREIAKSLEKVFSFEPHLAERSKQWRPATELVSTYPLVFRESTPIIAEQNILNVGDAAGFIDPFVGDGISIALHSGRMAAACLEPFFLGISALGEATGEYSRQYARHLLPAFRNALRLRKMASSPSLRKIAMELLRVPAFSRFALRSTRARVA